MLHAADDAEFDNFFLLWAMSLRVIRRKWGRIVFMQTNREDVEARYRQIRIPIGGKERALEVSAAFRNYHLGVQELRVKFLEYLSESDKYHIFLSSIEAVEEEIAEEVAAAD